MPSYEEISIYADKMNLKLICNAQFKSYCNKCLSVKKVMFNNGLCITCTREEIEKQLEGSAIWMKRQ